MKSYQSLIFYFFVFEDKKLCLFVLGYLRLTGTLFKNLNFRAIFISRAFARVFYKKVFALKYCLPIYFLRLFISNFELYNGQLRYKDRLEAVYTLLFELLFNY